MTTLPVLRSCADCAHMETTAASGVVWSAPVVCGLAKRDLPDEDVVPDWCPLRESVPGADEIAWADEQRVKACAEREAAEACLAAIDDCDVNHALKCSAQYDNEQPCTCGLARALPELDAHWRQVAREKRERGL